MSLDFLEDAAQALNPAYEKTIIIAIDKDNTVNFVSHHFPKGERGKQQILKALSLSYKNLDLNHDQMVSP